MDGSSGWIVFEGIHDKPRVPEGRLRIHEVLRPTGKRDPLSICTLFLHVRCEIPQLRMDVSVRTQIPFIEGGPGGLEGADDAFFEGGAVLLHYDDGFLEEVFFEDLAGELAGDAGVGDVAGGRKGDRVTRERRIGRERVKG